MNKLLVFLGFFILACNNQNLDQSKTPILSADDEKTLRYLKEVEWPKAYREQDTVLLNRILGNDFQMVDNGGHWSSKKDELNWIKANAPEYDSFRFEIKRLDILPNGTALICGTGHIEKDTIKSIYQSSNILIKRQGIWKAVASHVSGYKTLERQGE